MEFEDILEQTGGFGKFQWYLSTLFVIPVYCVVPWMCYGKIFMLSVPQHWCNVPELALSNLSLEEQRTLISPSSDPSCSMYSINYTDMLLKGIFKVSNDTDVMPCNAGWKYDSGNYENTAATKWDMVCKYDYLPSLILTMYNVGVFIGTPVFSFLSDKFGRKIVYLCLSGLVMVTELASALTSDVVVFSILRLINGSSFPTLFALPYILVNELVPPSMRAHMNGLINCCWTLGLCFLPLIAYLTRSWTFLCLVVAASGLVLLSYFRFLPESPSWLITQGRIEEATDIMVRIAKLNGISQNRTEMLHILQKLKEKKQEKKDDPRSSRNVILRYPRLRRNFFVISFCWVAFTTAYNGLTFNMVNLSGNEFINFFLISVVEFPGNFFFWYAMDAFGRRWTASLGFFFTGIGCLISVIGFEKSDILSSMVGKLLCAGVVMVTDQQSMELFPTVARSFGYGVGKTIAAALTVCVPFIAYLNIYGKSLPFVVISSTCFLAFVLALFLPESLDENLPQTIEDADAFGKDQKFFSWKRKTTSEKSAEVIVSTIETHDNLEFLKQES